MTIRAKIYIQGAGNYLAHEDGDQLLVLFPNQDRYEEHASQARSKANPLPEAKELCAHYPMIQMDSRHLTGEGRIDGDAPWVTLHLNRQWVGFEIEGEKRAMDLPGGRVPDIPQMDDLLGCEPEYADGVLPPGNPKDLSERVAAGLYLNAGAVQSPGTFSYSILPYADAVAEPDTSDPQEFASVTEVDLGDEVTGLSLLLRPFGPGARTTEVQLHPVRELGTDLQTIEIWIRHFCQVTPPALCVSTLEENRIDDDFLLNYLLLKNPVKALETAKIPVLAGFPGTDCVQCQRPGGLTSFGNPFAAG